MDCSGQSTRSSRSSTGGLVVASDQSTSIQTTSPNLEATRKKCGHTRTPHCMSSDTGSGTFTCLRSFPSTSLARRKNSGEATKKQCGSPECIDQHRLLDVASAQSPLSRIVDDSPPIGPRLKPLTRPIGSTRLRRPSTTALLLGSQLHHAAGVLGSVCSGPPRRVK